MATTMRRKLAILALSVVLFIGTAAALEGSPKLDPEQLIQHLDRAKGYFERAKSLPVHDGRCDKFIRSAVSQLTNAKIQANKKDWKSVRESVAFARDANVDCVNTLKSNIVMEFLSRHSEYSTASALSRALSYLTLQAERQMAAAADKLGEPTKPKTAPGKPSSRRGDVTDDNADKMDPRKGCAPKLVDGTTCQYSKCAQGLGLPSCSIGFAKGVVGGSHGKIYTVTSDVDDPSHPGPGSLRHGTNLARGTLGVWITFSRSMVIHLREMLWIQSRTTIDGRGFNVTINNRNIVLGGVRNVIIHNIQINSIRGSDAIHIFAGSAKIWIDHVHAFSAESGLVSVLQGATDVTISNCRLHNDNFNMLLGASDADVEDKNMRVSVYRNWFYDSTQRMPHCRWGIFHVANNLYTNWGYYAIGARVNARVKSENNVFIAARATEVTPWFQGYNRDTFDTSARIESHGDLLLNKSTFHQFVIAKHSVERVYLDPAKYPPLVPPKAVMGLVKSCSGALFGRQLMECLD